MHYFNWNIKSYVAATVHLSNAEDLAYRRLLDHYYDTELPIPSALPMVCRRLRLDLPDVEMVLNEFFILKDDGWHNQYCDDEISKYKAFITRQKENGSKGGRGNKADAKSNKPTALQENANAKPTKNKEQRTNKQVTKKDSAIASRLPDDWMPSDEHIEFCRKTRADLEPLTVADRFRDYWIAQPGAKGRKVDWFATWRNWVRNESAASQARKIRSDSVRK